MRSGLLSSAERCGLAVRLSADHDETSESAERARLIRTEVARAWAVQDRATIPEAEAALTWLRAEATGEVQVGLPLGLVDGETGEVLVEGRPGAVLVDPNLVVSWKTGDPWATVSPRTTWA